MIWRAERWLAARRGRSRAALFAAGLVLLVLVAIGAALIFRPASVKAASPVAVFCDTLDARLSRWLQDGVVAHVFPGAEGIIVLGGGLHAYQAGDGGPGDRISAALSLASRFPEAVLIYTGAAEGAVGQIFAAHGLRDRLLLETEARTTFENARNVADLIGDRRSRPWVLVTSAWHMKRASATFRAQGFNVEPYPVDYLQDRRTGRCGAATREALSVLYYRLRGRL